MGNVGNSGGQGRRRGGSRRGHAPAPSPQTPRTPPPPPPPPEINANHFIFGVATSYPPPRPPPYPAPNPPQFYPYSGYYHLPPPPPPPFPLPVPFDQHHQQQHGSQAEPAHVNLVAEQYQCPVPPRGPYVEYQKAVTIRNDVNLKKETLKVELDRENSVQFLVTFTFDATVAGSITVFFFAKEGADCNLTSKKENLKPVTVAFKQGLGQKFRQAVGTGVDLSMFDESELVKKGDMEVYPLAVKAEAAPLADNMSANSQITQAIFVKEKGEYQVRVKQILWVNDVRYELQEIYGIGNSVDGDHDKFDPGKECVVCLTEPQDTTVLPCRHMCMCSGCAKVLRFQTNRCPICRQPVEWLLEIKVNGRPEE